MWPLFMLCLAREQWQRPGKIQPLNVAHTRTQRHVAFIEGMRDRHRAFGPVVRRIGRRYGAVTVMVVNDGQFHMLENFIAACDRRSIPCRDMVFAFALDSRAAAKLEALRISYHHYTNTEHTRAARTFADSDFAKVVFFKSAVVYDVLSLGVNVLFQDVDVVWKGSPIAELMAYDVDVCFMNDGNSKYQQPLYLNSGFFLVRHNERTMALWREAFEVFDRQHSQQPLLERLVVHHYFNNALTVFILPPRFANGDRWTPTRPIAGQGWIVAHASWTQNVTYKVMKFKQIGEWYLP